MKAFFALGPLPAALFLLSATGAAAPSEYPQVSSPLAELRRAPTFGAETISLAKTWGIALPIGSSIQVEKVYGRWVYGRALPLPHMRAADNAPPGWIFSRQLIMPGDTDTLTRAQAEATRNVLFYARVAARKLSSTKPNASPSRVEFLETLTLSQKTLKAFSMPEPLTQGKSLSVIESAFAADDEKAPAPMGLTGSDLSFLDQEIRVIQNRKQKEARARESKRLKSPALPPLSNETRTGVLGRFMLDRYLEIPNLTMEEVDGFIYMRATAQRALLGCPASIQRYWKNRRWNFFRVFRLTSRPEVGQPWFEIALPGGYFAVSGRAIEQAADEAELAFLLVRQMVREPRIKRKAPRFDAKTWPTSLPALSEEIWEQVLKAQSTKDAENLDVADEIAIDTQAVECIARAGYRPMSGLSYLRRLSANKNLPWAAWFEQHTIGLGYRIERLAAITQENVAQQKIPDGKDAQAKRFSSAARQWNVLP